MKRVLFVIVALLLCTGLGVAQEYDYFVYLPWVAGGEGTATPTETPIVTTTPTLTPTISITPTLKS